MKAILTYHSIDDSGSPISVSPEVFEAQAIWLASGRVRVLSLDEFAAHPDDAGDAVSLTFDDGFLNTRGPMERLLADGLPLTVFVVTRRVGMTNAWGGCEQPGIPTLPLVSWNDIDSLAKHGAVIASHSRTHPRLTTITPAMREDELLGSLDDLQARLDIRNPHMAYPYGDVDDVVVAHAARYYRFGCTTDFRLSRAADAPLRLPRLDMYYFRATGALEAWGSWSFLRRVAWCRARRAVRALGRSRQRRKRQVSP